MKAINFIHFLKNLFHINKNRYEYKNKNNQKWVYISYIPRVYYKKKDSPWFFRHQNRREALVIGEVFKKLGYNYTMATYNKKEECSDRKYDLIFGLEPNFVTMAQRNPQALKIFYATEAFSEFQSQAVKTRTDEFNRTHQVNLSYSRSKPYNQSYDLSDAIFQIGTQITIETYPEKYRKKITLINQSSNNLNSITPEQKHSSFKRNEFIWLGSDGSLLKGLDLVLDFFLKNPQLKLHIAGKVDEDFLAYYKPLLEKAPNIKFYGFLDLQGEIFKEIIKKITFNIFPSASEGGCPGSVIALMYEGVIPVVSKWGSFEDISDHGYMLEDLSMNSIEKAIHWTNSLSDEHIKDLITRNMQYARSRWNLEGFKVSFENSLKQFLQQNKVV